MTTALTLKGVLDIKKYQELTEKERKTFFIRHANEVLPVLIRPNWYDDPDVEYLHEYEISAQYVLLDSFYTECGNVNVSLTWSRTYKSPSRLRRREPR